MFLPQFFFHVKEIILRLNEQAVSMLSPVTAFLFGRHTAHINEVYFSL